MEPIPEFGVRWKEDSGKRVELHSESNTRKRIWNRLRSLGGTRRLGEIETNTRNHTKHAVQDILHHQRLRIVQIQREFGIVTVHYTSHQSRSEYQEPGTRTQ